MQLFQIERRLPARFRIGILGSTSFHDPRSKNACNAIGRALSANDCALVTGGLSGIPHEVSKGFDADERTFHLLLYPWPLPCGGTTIRTGWSMRCRRRILAQVCPLYVCVEGGPGTAHETRLIRERNLPIIPLGCFGGHSQELYPQMDLPVWAVASSWNAVGNAGCCNEDVVAALTGLVTAFMRFDMASSTG